MTRTEQVWEEILMRFNRVEYAVEEFIHSSEKDTQQVVSIIHNSIDLFNQLARDYRNGQHPCELLDIIARKIRLFEEIRDIEEKVMTYRQVIDCLEELTQYLRRIQEELPRMIGRKVENATELLRTRMNRLRQQI